MIRQRRRILAAVFLSALASSAPELLAQEPTCDVQAAERYWDEVVANGDRDAYRQLLADEFTWTYVTGEVIDKEEAVNRLSPFRLKRVSKQFLEYGNTVVVYGTASLDFQGRPLNERFVRIWAKNDSGSWQAVLFQATEIQ